MNWLSLKKRTHKRLAVFFICLIIVPCLLAPASALAQDSTGGSSGQESGGYGSTVGNIISGLWSINPINWGIITPAKQLAGTAVGAYARDAVATVVAYLAAIAMHTTAFVLWLSGKLLGEVATYTVVNMSGNIRGITGIDIAWKVFRDLANMCFIFIILWIAIGTILDLNGINTRKMLVNVVIIALLLNFSLFFTKIIIDASNVVSLGFYNKIVTSAGGQDGLAGPFMQNLGITGFFDLNSLVSQQLNINKTLIQIFMTGYFSSIFFIITSIVFLAIALMLIVRFVILIFLMILSPLAFAAMALPKDEWSGRWWKSLFNQALFAPAVLAMLYASLLVVSGVNKTLNPAGLSHKAWSELFTGINENAEPSINSIHIVLNFIILMVLMVGSLLIAKEFGAHGSKWGLDKISSGRKWMQGKIGRGVVRGTGIAKLDKKFGDSAFGKSKLGRGIRSITTAPITNADFGSGQSVQKVNKAVKKLNEDYAKTVAETPEKDFKKNINKYRQQALSERLTKEVGHLNLVDAYGNTVANASHQIREAADREEFENEAKIKRGEILHTQGLGEARQQERELRGRMARGEFTTQTEYDDAENRLRETQAVIKRTETAMESVKSKRELATHVEETQKRIAGNALPTKDEERDILRPRQRDALAKVEAGNFLARAAKKGMPVLSGVGVKFLRTDARAEAVKLLREKSRGGGKTELEQQWEEFRKSKETENEGGSGGGSGDTKKP